MVGGWRNRALDDMLSLEECSYFENDKTRLGVWNNMESQLKVGREKFVSLPVPKQFLVGSPFCLN